MTKEEFIKLQEAKKQMQLQLGSINYSLDIIRTSITLITYNLTENDKIKKLPAFNYDKARHLCSELNGMVAGLSDEYFSANIPGYERFNPNSKPTPKDAIDPTNATATKQAKKEAK